MSKKYKITLEAEQGQQITIQPLGETMTTVVTGNNAAGGTTTTTMTNAKMGADAGADSDTDM